MPRRQTTFQFDGGAATFLGTALLAWMVSFVTLGLFFPYSVVLMMRWGAKHTTVQGRRLAFYGSAAALLGHWLLWWLLTIITFGIYGFWVVPRMTRWVVENTDFDPASAEAVSLAGFAPVGVGGFGPVDTTMPLPTSTPPRDLAPSGAREALGFARPAGTTGLQQPSVEFAHSAPSAELPPPAPEPELPLPTSPEIPVVLARFCRRCGNEMRRPTPFCTRCGAAASTSSGVSQF